MPSGQSLRTQVRAYRFASRQVEWSLMHGDPLPAEDPASAMRRWTGIGVVLTVLGLAGMAVWGLVQPKPDWRDSALLIDSSDGQILVNRNGTLYPALNLTSALLVQTRTKDAGAQASGQDGQAPPTPKRVSSEDIADAPRGPMVGIPGAPNRLPTASSTTDPIWSLCETISLDPAMAQPSLHPTIVSTAVIGTRVAPRPLGTDRAVVVHAAGSSQLYLLWNGHRSAVDASDAAVIRAFGLPVKDARQVEPGLLDAIPEAAPLRAPSVAHRGAKPDGFAVGELMVGSVFRVPMTPGSRYFVVLRDGIQRIPSTVADLLRLTYSPSATIPQVAPDRISSAPTTDQPIAVDQFPPSKPTYLDVASDPVLCTTWNGTGRGTPSTGLAAGSAVTKTSGPGADAPITLARNATSGVDRVIIDGSGVAVRDQSGAPDSAVGTVYLVGANGVRYPVPSTSVLTGLGIGGTVARAPRGILEQLPKGPTLDPAAAARLWDSVPVARSSQGATLPTVQHTAPDSSGG